MQRGLMLMCLGLAVGVAPVKDLAYFSGVGEMDMERSETPRLVQTRNRSQF